MKYQFPLSSQRLDFQPLSLDDCEAWEQFFIDNPGLEYLGISEPGTPEEESRIWIERQLKRYVEMGWGHLKLVNRQTGEMVGNAGLILREEEGEEVLEIGYSIIPTHWRKGYATEAAIRLKEYIQEHQLYDKAVSFIHAENINSQIVAEKNGMKRGRKWEYMGMPIYTYSIQF